jgi:hypothetical protein
MPARDPRVREVSARLAAEERWHPEADTSDLRRDLRAARAAQYIRDLTDSLPALTVEQRARLARLLLPGGAA